MPPAAFLHLQYAPKSLVAGAYDHGEFKESDCENDRQLEIAIWPPKPEVLISLEL